MTIVMRRGVFKNCEFFPSIGPFAKKAEQKLISHARNNQKPVRQVNS
jgi:hypothetical protein